MGRHTIPPGVVDAAGVVVGGMVRLVVEVVEVVAWGLRVAFASAGLGGSRVGLGLSSLAQASRNS